VNERVSTYVCFQGILLELTTPSRPTPADEDRTETRPWASPSMILTPPLMHSGQQVLPSPVSPGAPRPSGIVRHTSSTHRATSWPCVNGERRTALALRIGSPPTREWCDSIQRHNVARGLS
jgi:hypothetical protein